MDNNNLSPGKKAKNTGIWAKTMTKWFITYSSKNWKKWHFVSFEGKNKGESRGVVDFIAIRRDQHLKKEPLMRGDLFEIILFQVKGGSAPEPTEAERIRLRKVRNYYKAKNVILSSWQKGKKPKFKYLGKTDWMILENLDEIFK